MKNGLLKSLIFKSILSFCWAFYFVLATLSQASNLKEEDKQNQMPGDPHEASLLIDEIVGVYKKRFKNSTVTGETYMSEDILEVVKVTENTIYFKLSLNFFNGHTCFLYGTAYYTKDKAFLFKQGTEEDKCMLKIKPTDEGIVLVDGAYGSNECRGRNCGVRGSLDCTFYKKWRRPIKYMKILKNSTDYQESIKELTNK